jgi:hypothetical protein
VKSSGPSYQRRMVYKAVPLMKVVTILEEGIINRLIYYYILDDFNAPEFARLRVYMDDFKKSINLYP